MWKQIRQVKIEGVSDLKIRSIVSRDLGLFLIVSVVLPVLALAGAGAYFIVQQGHLLWFLGGLAAATLVTTCVFSYFTRSGEMPMAGQELVVQPSSDWSAQEHEIWDRGTEFINELLRENDDWSQLQGHAMSVVQRVADEYGCTKWDFPVPASLRMIEEVSRRYRRTLQTHVPFVEALKVSHVRYALQNQEKIGRLGRFIRVGRNLWRGVRLINPAAALASEVRDYFTGELFAKVSVETQFQLKAAFLQDVLSVAMDLYSGRFNIDEGDLEPSGLRQEDRDRMVVALDPIRVAVVGQENSGKSSLVNALCGEVNAQVDVLPVAGDTTVYQCSIEGVEYLHLAELPAIQSQKASLDNLLSELTQSDIVIWILKADQPARGPDMDLYSRFDEYYRAEDSLQKKKPVLMGVLSHVDALNASLPGNESFDLEKAGSEHVSAIEGALRYNQDLFGFETLLPLCLSADQKGDNLAAVVTWLEQNYDAAVHVQLNRRGREARQRNVSMTEQAKRIARTGKAIFSKVIQG